MRVAPGDVAKVLRDLTAVPVVLFFGDDLGLVRERATMAARTVLGPEDDPFRLDVLAREEHGRLLDVSCALCLTGGRRVVRVLDAGDGLVAALSRWPDSMCDALVILEAGALTGRSKLRVLVEKRQTWAAVACYPASQSMILAEIKAAAAAARCAISTSAAARLTAMLPLDTAARRSELQKLITYVGLTGVIDEEAIDFCIDADLILPMGDLFDAVLGGHSDRTAILFQDLVCEGTTGPQIIAAFNNHVQRILKVRLLIDSGVPPDTACAKLAPPAYPRQVAGLMRQVAGWSIARLMQLQENIKAADLACKRAGARDVAIVGRLMVAAASRASVS